MKQVLGMRHGVLLCLAAVVLTAIVDAQPPGGGRGGRPQRGGDQQGRRGQFGGGFGGGGFRGGQAPGGGVSRTMLLGAAKVREELNIDAGQGATIDAALEAYRDERRSGTEIDFRALRDMEESERNAILEKSRKEREELTKKTDDVLMALLEPEQAARLDQISLQLRLQGDVIGLLQDDDMKKKLGISEDQVAKLDAVREQNAELQQAMRERMMEAFRSGGRENFDMEAMRAEGEKMRETAMKNAMAVLTSEQSAKLNEMKGRPFEVDMRQLFGRGGRPGGGFGGGRPGGGRPGGGGDGQARGRGGRPPADEDPSVI